MEFTLARRRIDKLPRERIVDELLSAARSRDFVEFGRREFDACASISANSVVREFGSWANAVAHLKEVLAATGRTLLPRSRAQHSDTQCFAELERIWLLLGHRPSRLEWERSEPAISYNTYKRRYGGWTNACVLFLETRGVLPSVVPPPSNATPSKKRTALKPAPSSRDVPAGLRLRVYERDRFRCIYCGRSPISSPGVQLHVDHIHPVAEGGTTVIENLQTLCADCNLGKGRRTDVAAPYA